MFFSSTSSSFVKVSPLPIRSWFSDHSRMSYFGSRSFQLTRVSSFVHPRLLSESTPNCSTISNVMSAMLHPFSLFYLTPLFLLVFHSVFLGFPLFIEKLENSLKR